MRLVPALATTLLVLASLPATVQAAPADVPRVTDTTTIVTSDLRNDVTVPRRGVVTKKMSRKVDLHSLRIHVDRVGKVPGLTVTYKIAEVLKRKARLSEDFRTSLIVSGKPVVTLTGNTRSDFSWIARHTRTGTAAVKCASDTFSVNRATDTAKHFVPLKCLRGIEKARLASVVELRKGAKRAAFDRSVTTRTAVGLQAAGPRVPIPDCVTTTFGPWNATGTARTLNWDAVAGADSYEVSWTYAGIPGPGTVYQTFAAGQPSYEFTSGTMGGHKADWFVVALNASGASGVECQSNAPGVPAEPVPACVETTFGPWNAAGTARPMRWAPVTGADSYEISWTFAGERGPGTIYQSLAAGQSSYEVTTGTMGGHKADWWVVAVNESGDADVVCQDGGAVA